MTVSPEPQLAEPKNELEHWIQITDHIPCQYRVICDDCTLDKLMLTLDGAKYLIDYHNSHHPEHVTHLWEHDNANE